MNDFWINNGDKILVGIITAIVVLFLSEPLKALFKKMGNWIEAGFQSLGFGFQKRYYGALVEDHKWLKLIGIVTSSDYAPRLQEVYISLRLNTAKESPTVIWDRIFNANEKHMVILGQPGAGKSTLLDYLTLIFTGHINHPLNNRLGKPLPIFARLRDLSKSSKEQSLLNLIESPENSKLKKVPAGYFERHLKKGNCVVLLDGLDEVLDIDSHKKVVEEIQAFVNEYPDNWVVVTCREQGWHNQLPSFRPYRVQEFDRDDVRQFIGAWYREVIRTEAILKLGNSPKPDARLNAEKEAYQISLKQAERLWGALLKNEGLLRIARTPLILSLITLVHKNRERDLPKGRERLYRDCLDILLDIWDSKDKGLTLPEDAPSPKDKLLALKTVAFHYLENSLLEMDKEGLEGLVAPLLTHLTKPVSAESLIRQIYERSGVLVEQAISNKYGFAHRALHDYLAALYISDQNLDSLLISHAGEEPWREVILIAIGIVKPHQRAEILLKSLLLQSGENAASLALAGWSLAEDIQIGEDLRSSVKERILEKLEVTENAGDFSLLSSALMDTDSIALRDWMQSVLLGSNPNLRMRVLNTLLPELGPEKSTPFTPILTKILADSHAENGLRMHCAMVLGRIKPFADAELWHALESARQEKDKWLKATATWAWCELGRYEELGLVKVPAGDFLMGSSDTDQYAGDSEKPQHSVYLPAFYIGKHPVTVSQYRAFTQENTYKTDDEDSLKGIDNYPVVNVSWNDANAFVQSQGMALPSEAQWEKVARGEDGWIYPWGNDWRAGLANTDEYWSSSTRGLWAKIRRKQTGATTPIGFFSPRGDSPYGCTDMTGNVWEWTKSIYNQYPYKADDGREDLQSKEDRVLRGGSFFNNHGVARCANRNGNIPLILRRSDGFRVAVSPILSL